jgi:hypothetical protein
MNKSRSKISFQTRVQKGKANSQLEVWWVYSRRSIRNKNLWKALICSRSVNRCRTPSLFHNALKELRTKQLSLIWRGYSNPTLKASLMLLTKLSYQWNPTKNRLRKFCPRLWGRFSESDFYWKTKHQMTETIFSLRLLGLAPWRP